MIYAAALELEGKAYFLARPARHHNVIEFMVDNLQIPNGKVATAKQGFMDDQYGFINRKGALNIVKNQPHRHKRRFPDEDLGRGGELYSEDLW